MRNVLSPSPPLSALVIKFVSSVVRNSGSDATVEKWKVIKSTLEVECIFKWQCDSGAVAVVAEFYSSSVIRSRRRRGRRGDGTDAHTDARIN